MAFNIILVFVIIANTFVIGQRSNAAIDTSFLESVLDADECDRQISYIQGNALLGLQFADAGARFPRGVLQGGFVDLGNYHQCLAIEHSADDMTIHGKFCSVRVPADETEEFGGRWQSPNLFNFDSETASRIQDYNLIRAGILALGGNLDAVKEFDARTSSSNPLSGATFTLGVCLPKPCTTHQAINSLLFNVSAAGIQFTEDYCRLPGDKPFSNADIVAVVIFSVLGLITLLSTCYDLYHRFLLKTDKKAINPVYTSFSVYTNGQRLMTFSNGAGNLQCIDGIRTLAMIWVIIGHSFSTEPHIANPLDSFTWMISAEGLWVTAGTMTVDTFFTLGGILLVYTTAGKMKSMMLLKNIHMFYLSRIVRITPLLAVTVLLQASFFNHIADGPAWQEVARNTNTCRDYWWHTLLHVQNLLRTDGMCIGHTWYVAIDMQLYIVSPLVLFWVLTGNRRKAWSALIGSLMIVLIASTIFNFLNNLQAGVIVPSRDGDMTDYWKKYYMHPLTRAAPFFVGLIAGYILHLYRDRKVHLEWIQAVFLWICSFAVMGAIFYFKYRILQLDWDNQFMDNFMNSFMRPAWACVISWIIFACVHGYGGPANWLLTLDVWRVPARLTYGMYLLHYPFMFTINGTMVTPIYFSVGGFTFKFLSHLALAAIVSYVVTILVESPSSTLFKQLMLKGQPKKLPPTENTSIRREIGDKIEHLNEVQITAANEAKTRQINEPAVTMKL